MVGDVVWGWGRRVSSKNSNWPDDFILLIFLKFDGYSESLCSKTIVHFVVKDA